MRKHLIEAFLVALWLVTAGLWAWSHFHHTDAPVSPPVKPQVHINAPAAPAKEVTKIERVEVPVTKVVAYKSEAKKALNLPKEIQADDKQHVIQAATVEPDDHPQTVTTVLDTDTGESKVLVQEEPLPWLARDKHGDAGLYIGYQGGIPTARVEARQGLIQVKAVHIGLMASADQPLNGGRVDAFIGAGAWLRW